MENEMEDEQERFAEDEMKSWTRAWKSQRVEEHRLLQQVTRLHRRKGIVAAVTWLALAAWTGWTVYKFSWLADWRPGLHIAPQAKSWLVLHLVPLVGLALTAVGSYRWRRRSYSFASSTGVLLGELIAAKRRELYWLVGRLPQAASAVFVVATAAVVLTRVLWFDAGWWTLFVLGGGLVVAVVAHRYSVTRVRRELIGLEQLVEPHEG